MVFAAPPQSLKKINNTGVTMTREKLKVVDSDSQQYNALLSCQIQPMFLVKKPYGIIPQRYKQAKAYLDLVAYPIKNKKLKAVQKTGIYLYFKIHNPFIKSKLNGISSFRIVLHPAVLKTYLQLQSLLVEKVQSKNIESVDSIEKITKYPKYWIALKDANEGKKRIKKIGSRNCFIEKDMELVKTRK